MSGWCWYLFQSNPIHDDWSLSLGKKLNVNYLLKSGIPIMSGDNLWWSDNCIWFLDIELTGFLVAGVAQTFSKLLSFHCINFLMRNFFFTFHTFHNFHSQHDKSFLVLGLEIKLKLRLLLCIRSKWNVSRLWVWVSSFYLWRPLSFFFNNSSWATGRTETGVTC